ncbi:RAD-like 6 [Hibiscus syriacus]|uniref:RAD-like 6 n=1 Tax=Hibiscus syriacus TaxID=106335 RepID=A0A6A3D930_HIBSY|nr:RAD-like 6 [Hibiscus syriacus]
MHLDSRWCSVERLALCYMVMGYLALISQILDDLRAAKFVPDEFEEEAGKVVRELLQRGAAASDSMEYAEIKVLQTAASKLLCESDYRSANRHTIVWNEGEFGSNNPNTNFMHAHSFNVESRMENKQNDAPDNKLSIATLPEEFRCPISSRLMYDPVIIASGRTFERIWIQKWLDDGNDTCPKTGVKLTHLSLTQSATMKDMISKWCMKYGITIQDPSMQPNLLHLLETSSTSIPSFGSCINGSRLPLDISNISLGSLDASYISDGSRYKNGHGSSLAPEQNNDDLCRDHSSGRASKMDLESLSNLADLDWESQYKMVEVMKNNLESDDLACFSTSSENFIEPLIKFLSSGKYANDSLRVTDYNEQQSRSDNVATGDANNYARDKKSHKELFGVKFPLFSKKK